MPKILKKYRKKFNKERVLNFIFAVELSQRKCWLYCKMIVKILFQEKEFWRGTRCLNKEENT